MPRKHTKGMIRMAKKAIKEHQEKLDVSQIPLDELEKVCFPEMRQILIKKRVFLYRNLVNTAFPERCTPEERIKIRDAFVKFFENFEFDTPPFDDGTVYYRPSKDEDDLGLDYAFKVATVMQEGILDMRFAEHFKEGCITHVIGDACAIINDEDHLTVMVCSDYDLPEVFDTYDQLLTQAKTHVQEFESEFTFAHSDAYGYLSANPLHVGSGMKLQACFCFMGLYLSHELESVLRGIERLGFEVSPYYVSLEKEPSHAFAYPGQCYVISWLGITMEESEALSRMERIVEALIQAERFARIRMRRYHRDRVANVVLRSVARATMSAELYESELYDIARMIFFGYEMDNLELTTSQHELLKEVFEMGSHAWLRRYAFQPPDRRLPELTEILEDYDDLSRRNRWKWADVEQPNLSDAMKAMLGEIGNLPYCIEYYRLLRAKYLKQTAMCLLPQCFEDIGLANLLQCYLEDREGMIQLLRTYLIEKEMAEADEPEARPKKKSRKKKNESL